MIDDKWRAVPCSCCGGIQWGGEEPRECRDCDGSGGVWMRPSGHVAQYPGGPWLGKWDAKYYATGKPLTPSTLETPVVEPA